MEEVAVKWKGLEYDFSDGRVDDDQHTAAIIDIETRVKASLHRFEVGSSCVISRASHAKIGSIYPSLLEILLGSYSLGKH